MIISINIVRNWVWVVEDWAWMAVHDGMGKFVQKDNERKESSGYRCAS